MLVWGHEYPHSCPWIPPCRVMLDTLPPVVIIPQKMKGMCLLGFGTPGVDIVFYRIQNNAELV